MGSNTTTTQGSSTSNSINQIPQWASNAGQQNYGLAQQIAQQPLQQYQGQMVADVSPQTQQSWNTAANSGNVGSDQFNASTAGYLSAMNQGPQNVTAAQSALANPYTAATGGPAAQSALSQSALATPMTASQAGLSQLSGTNLQPYMNPYTQSVINATLPIMQQGLAQSQNQQQNAANSANAYGGSRQAIQQGVTQVQGALAQEQMASQLNQANFAQAQQAGEFDVTAANNMSQYNTSAQNAAALNNMNAANNMNQFNATAANNMGQFNAGALNNMAQFGATAQNQAAATNMAAANNMSQYNTTAQNTAAAENQAAAQANINSRIQGAQGLTNTGQAMNQANTANFAMQQSSGAAQQMQAQDQINAQMAKFSQAFNYPQQQLGILEGSLGMTPYDTSTSGQTQSQSSTTTPTDWSGIIENGAKSAASLYSMLPSDRRLKKDIEKVGKHPVGVPLYSFRYKGDDPSSPKVLGPMAQDVQKKVPEAVGKIPGSGGMLAIHTPTLDAASKPRHYAAGTAFVAPPSLAAFTPKSSPGVAKGISALSAFRPAERMPRGFGIPKMQARHFANGGMVQGKGTGDTVPAMLTPGEAVLTRSAAQQMGRGNITALNKPRGMAGALSARKPPIKLRGALSA